MWSVMEPTSSGLSSTALSNIKRVLTIADQYDIKVNLDFWTQFGYTLGFPTSWAGTDYYSLLSNPTKGYYLSYIKDVVNELKGYDAIESWSILNEPYYSSSSQKIPFQTLMSDCVQTIRSVDNTHDVVCRFTLSYTPGSGKYDSSVYDLFDAFAVTEYLDPSNPSDTRYNARWSYWDKTVADCKARNLPLWVIEFGDDNTSTEHVREHYQLSMEKFATDGVVKAYAWAWQTRSATNEAFNIYSGSSPDPAYYELTKYPDNSGSGTTPTATTKPTTTTTPTATPTSTHTPTSTGSLSYPKAGDIAYGSTTSAYKPWTLKEDCIPEFIALADKYGGSYESIGKSSNGQWDIIMFKFGNPNGAKIMIDAQLHGNEYYSYETLYALATWLLTSNDAEAKQILENNYVLMVPVVDYRWGRTNYNSPSWMTTNDPSMDGGDCGVNLNRNFSPGWSSSLSTSNTDSYSGVAPNSEAETQALINAWKTYQPQIYWNLHQGASPMTSCSATTTQAKADANAVKSILPTIQSRLGVTSGWTFSVGSGSSGYAKDGAAAQGCAGFLTEVLAGWDNSASKLADLTSGNTFKQVKAMFIAMCTAISDSDPTPTTTPSPTPTPTVTPTPTPTSTPTPTATATPKPTATPTATATPKPTFTPNPTSTSTTQPTTTPKQTPTPTPTEKAFTHGWHLWRLFNYHPYAHWALIKVHFSLFF
jgi:predicted deacylase